MCPRGRNLELYTLRKYTADTGIKLTLKIWNSQIKDIWNKNVH